MKTSLYIDHNPVTTEIQLSASAMNKTWELTKLLLENEEITDKVEHGLEFYFNINKAEQRAMPHYGKLAENTKEGYL